MSSGHSKRNLSKRQFDKSPVIGAHAVCLCVPGVVTKTWRLKIVVTLFAVLFYLLASHFKLCITKTWKAILFKKLQPTKNKKKRQKRKSQPTFSSRHRLCWEFVWKRSIAIHIDVYFQYHSHLWLQNPRFSTQTLENVRFKTAPERWRWIWHPKRWNKTHRFVTWFLSLLVVPLVFIFAGTKCPRKTLWCFSFQGVWLCCLYFGGVALNLENRWLLKSTMNIGSLAATYFFPLH